MLFSAGMEGKIYGWKLDAVFDQERKADEEIEYNEVIFRGMPWREEECIMDLVELTSINQLASASVDKCIRLWDLSLEFNRAPRKVL